MEDNQFETPTEPILEAPASEPLLESPKVEELLQPTNGAPTENQNQPIQPAPEMFAQTPVTEQIVPETVTQVAAPKKSKKVFIIITSIILVALIAVSCYIYFVMLANK